MSLPTDETRNPNHSLREHLERIGLRAVAAQMDDMLAHATQQRWSRSEERRVGKECRS